MLREKWRRQRGHGRETQAEMPRQWTGLRLPVLTQKISVSIRSEEYPARNRSQCRRRRQPRWLWPGFSSDTPQPDQCFDVIGLGKKIEEVHRGDFVTMVSPRAVRGLMRSLHQNCQIARECWRIARKICDFFRSEGGEFLRGRLPKSCARRIENNKIRHFGSCLQKLLSLYVLGNDRCLGSIGVFTQISRCREIRVDANHTLKYFR